VLTSPDGEQVVVRGFFAAETPPKLTLPEGAEFSGSLAAKLAGPQAPAQYAQAGPDAAVTQPIGTVENLVGAVTVTRADGTQAELEIGDPVFQGDILESGEDGAIGIVFADETSFSMAENGRMVLDEMIYDPGEGTGEMAVSVVRGVFTFVSGQIAKTDPEAMTIETPVATIGVRGTQCGVDTGSDGQTLKLLMMTELVEQPDGSVIEVVGELQVAIGGPVFTINQADFGLIAGVDGVQTRQFTPQEIVDGFANALGVMPSGGRQINRYGVEERGGGDLAGFDTAAGEEDAPPAPDVVATFTTEAEVTDGTLTLGDLILSVTQPETTGEGEAEGPTGGSEEVNEEGNQPGGGEQQTVSGNLILGTSGGDNILGGDDNNTIIGLQGSDILDGGGGDDTLYANSRTSFFFTNFDSEATTSGGALSSLSISSNELSATITRRDSNFDIELANGNNKLSPFSDTGGDTEFVIDFNVPMDFVQINFGDFGGDPLDMATLKAYSGANGTGTLLDTSSNTLFSSSKFFSSVFLSVSSFGAGIMSVTITGGTASGTAPNFPHSVFYDSLSAFVDDEFVGNTLIGGAGNDFLSGAFGNDLLDGGTGNDQLEGSLGNDILLGGSGSDDLFGGSSSDQLDGGDGDDYLDGGSSNDLLLGGGGNDTLRGSTGTDTYKGGDGIDLLDADFTSTDQTIILEMGVNPGSISGSGFGSIFGIENVNGGNGDDTIRGNEDDNTLDGDSGDDILDGYAGNDRLDGGSGTDAADYSGSLGGVNVDLSTGMALDGLGGTDTLVSIESAFGGAFDDLITGSSSANTLSGDAGNDTLLGGGGNDTLIGGSGAGDDTYDGGTGIDTVDYSSTNNGVDVALGAGSDQAFGSEIGTDQISNVENVIGGSEDDVISGDANANHLMGGGGSDDLSGNDGNDKLEGGADGDTLTGGAGDDIFRYTLSQIGTDGGDLITDFTPGQDSIEFFTFLFGTGALTNISMGFTTTTTFTFTTSHFTFPTTTSFTTTMQPDTAGSVIATGPVQTHTSMFSTTSFFFNTHTNFNPSVPFTVGNFKVTTLFTYTGSGPTNINQITFPNSTSPGIFVYAHDHNTGDGILYHTSNGGGSYQTVAALDGDPNLTANDINIVWA